MWSELVHVCEMSFRTKEILDLFEARQMHITSQNIKNSVRIF